MGLFAPSACLSFCCPWAGTVPLIAVSHIQIKSPLILLMGSRCSLRVTLDDCLPPWDTRLKMLWRHVLPSAPGVTNFIPRSMVIFFCAFQADNIGDRTSVLHSTPVRHPAFSWYLAIVFLLSFFFLFLNKQTLQRLP